MQPDGVELVALSHVQQATGIPCFFHFLAFCLPVHLVRLVPCLAGAAPRLLLLGRALACRSNFRKRWMFTQSCTAAHGTLVLLHFWLLESLESRLVALLLIKESSMCLGRRAKTVERGEFERHDNSSAHLDPERFPTRSCRQGWSSNAANAVSCIRGNCERGQLLARRRQAWPCSMRKGGGKRLSGSGRRMRCRLVDEDWVRVTIMENPKNGAAHMLVPLAAAVHAHQKPPRSYELRGAITIPFLVY